MPEAPRAPGSVPPWAGSRMTMLVAGRGVCCADCVCSGCGRRRCWNWCRRHWSRDGALRVAFAFVSVWGGVAAAGFGAAPVADGCCALAEFVSAKCPGANASAATSAVEMSANRSARDFSRRDLFVAMRCADNRHCNSGDSLATSSRIANRVRISWQGNGSSPRKRDGRVKSG